jgi:hypothetical protein
MAGRAAVALGGTVLLADRFMYAPQSLDSASLMDPVSQLDAHKSIHRPRFPGLCATPFAEPNPAIPALRSYVFLRTG